MTNPLFNKDELADLILEDDEWNDSLWDDIEETLFENSKEDEDEC
tara:strand:- start:466 stop:600 length:135 start_codon:yes stop_codon:yes gene_type:complete